jgi:uncharacterized membrane protein
MTHWIIILNALLPLILVTALLALTARTRRGVVFGVSLPLEVADSAAVTTAIKRFQTRLLALGTACIALTVTLITLHHTRPTSITRVAGTLLLIIAAYIMRSHEAKRLRPQAIDPPLTRSADLIVPDTTAQLALTAAPLLLIAATALWLRSHWDQIPARWPQHWNAAGEIDGWGHRSAGGVFFPLTMAAMLVLVFFIINVFNTKAPGTQMRQRAGFAAPLAAMCWVLTLVFCTLGLIPLCHFGIGAILALAGLSVAAIFMLVGWMLSRSGFFRSNSTAWTAEPYDGTPDRKWRSGIFYANRSDPAVVVQKRFGYGWTLNFARPVSWIFVGVVLLLFIAASALPLLHHR